MMHIQIFSVYVLLSHASVQIPTPGVTSFVPMMSNSAVTFDHILKPLPAFPTAKHPQVRLDPMVCDVCYYTGSREILVVPTTVYTDYRHSIVG